ncbi:MAG: cytochrome c3 family protein, partial [Desulfobacteraceae bacterium]|nr:cytochrome c3 family protein [Desulfobacteraceae bacterium]
MKRQTQKNIFLLSVILLLIGADASGKNVRFTRHNLSSSGPGGIKAASESRICIFCHTVKKARKNVPFLWNRQTKTVFYKPYASSTLSSNVGQPTGSSRVCLSCHDGTIALGGIVSKKGEIPFKGGIRFIPPERSSRLGTDLSDDHPISFVYGTGLVFKKDKIVHPSFLPPKVKLDKTGQLQCTTCHDPHDDTHGDFLVMSNRNSALCKVCHQIDGWLGSSHAESNARWNGRGKNPWTNNDYQTVAENGCENCHRSHTAGRHERLLKYVFEEDNCLACHSGNVSSKNIETELTKRFRHSVQNYTGVHDAAEDFRTWNVPKHVECDDCHNSHQSNGQASAGGSRVSGANKGVTGINSGGQQVSMSQNLYEICYKCHADNNVMRRFPITRQIDQLNTRMEFDLGNPSYHPVVAPGMNPDVPSLLSTISVNSIISCTDCHNTDNPAGPKGPHGSNYEFLLARNYDTADYTMENSQSYALCYKCHSRTSILNDESFSEHKKHIVDQKTPCAVCHDPHGVSNVQGNSTNNSHLINFQLTVALPNATGSLYFQDLGRFSGQCFLKCHSVEHDPKMYP